MKEQLSRREREILNVLYRQGEATVAQVLEELTDPPSYDGVRTTLRVLERKGYIRHRHHGPRYLYMPTEPLEKARSRALRQLVGTFFGGSPMQAAAALLELSESELSDRELDRLREIVGPEDEP